MPLTLTQRGARGVYYIRGTVAGQSIYASTGTSDRQAADAIRIKTEAQALKRASLGIKATITFAEAALNYLNSGGEGRFLPPLLHYFGPDFRLADVTNQAITTAAQKLYPNAKPSTINRQLITPISAILTMAVEDDLATPIKIRRRRVKEKKTRWLTPEEFERLAACADKHLIPIIGFMIGTGARVRETLALQAHALYFEQGQALLTETKNDRARMVRFPARAADMMDTRPLPEAGAVFTTNKGAPYRITDGTGGQIRRAFNNARDRAGIGPEVTPHTLRHTWATWHYSQNRDFGALLDLGGWSKADVANIYRKIAPDDLAGRLLAHGWDYRASGRIDNRQPITSPTWAQPKRG